MREVHPFTRVEAVSSHQSYRIMDLDAVSATRHVYYASYGSNLNSSRLLAYIEGGGVEGAVGCQFGCTDKTKPSHSFLALISGTLRFARTSKKWGGGGVCFVDPAGTDAKVPDSTCSTGSISAAVFSAPKSTLLVRAWRLTRRQFLDVYLQENSLNPAVDGHKATEAHLDSLFSGGFGSGLDIGRGWYSYLWYIGDAPDGTPVVTCTAHPELWASPASHAALAHNPPSLAYARIIYRGLKECGLDDDAAARYLSDRAQIELDAAALAAEAGALEAALPVEPARPTGGAPGAASGVVHASVAGSAAVSVASGGAGSSGAPVSTETSASFPPWVQLSFKR